MTASILEHRQLSTKVSTRNTHSKYATPAMTIVKNALGTSTLNRKGTAELLGALTTLTLSSTPCAVKSPWSFASGSSCIFSASGCRPLTTIYLLFRAALAHLCSRRDFAANKSRSVEPRMTRNIHVPAYPPSEVGVHESEYRGVRCELVKTISIMCDIVSSLFDCLSRCRFQRRE
jgi:hypothetical protein